MVGLFCRSVFFGMFVMWLAVTTYGSFTASGSREDGISFNGRDAGE